ncbi:MAG: hemerythrin domain-containing protein [Thermoplasmata archaeon]
MSAPEIPTPLEELQRENELIERLLERIEEIALLLQNGKNVALEEIAESLRLLDRYLGLHTQRMDHDLQPEARRVAMPSCVPHLDRVIHDHGNASVRARDALRALASYEDSSEASRRTFADMIEELASRAHDTVVFEGDYPLSCLASALPDDAAARVYEQFVTSERELKDTEIGIERLLARPLSESSAAPGEREPEDVRGRAEDLARGRSANDRPIERGRAGVVR